MPGPSRRTVLRSLLLVSLVPLTGAWWGLSRFRQRRARRASVTLPQPATDGLVFHRDVIIHRSGESLRAFSARCPHLGCVIDRSDDGRILGHPEAEGRSPARLRVDSLGDWMKAQRPETRVFAVSAKDRQKCLKMSVSKSRMNDLSFANS